MIEHKCRADGLLRAPFQRELKDRAVLSSRQLSGEDKKFALAASAGKLKKLVIVFSTF